jgi:hypothetical protein
MDNGTLTIHGLWNDIGAGTVEHYDENEKKFFTLSKD